MPWQFPIISFIRCLLPRNKLTWLCVIDKDSVTGSPPNLRSSKIVINEVTQPFSITLAKTIVIRQVVAKKDSRMMPEPITSTHTIDIGTVLNFTEPFLKNLILAGFTYSFEIIEIKS